MADGQRAFRGFSPPRWIVSATTDELKDDRDAAGGSNSARRNDDNDDVRAGYGPVLKRGNIPFVPAASNMLAVVPANAPSKGKQVQSLYQSIVGTSTSRSSTASTDQDIALIDQDDDDIVVIDPLTGEPEYRPRPSSAPKQRARVRATHELVAAPEAARPKLPPVYGIAQSNKGWQMLSRAGWSEGSALGVPRNAAAAVPPAPSQDVPAPDRKRARNPDSDVESDADDDSGLADERHRERERDEPGDDRLVVPLKASDKFDRKGLGNKKETKAERRERELREALGGNEQAVLSAKTLRRKEQRDRAYRQAMLAYMNR